MAQARVLHPNIQLVDITERFHTAAERLPPGQLVKDEYFTLFEAVGALEIGDPKMDSGCLEEGEDLEDEFDFSKSLSPEQVIWLMDELTCREVAWHKGYPLSQTLFTSMHIDKLLWPAPKQLVDAQFIRSPSEVTPDPLSQVFRAYCLGAIKCCDLVHTLITSQHYYEEEDFAPQLFNRELLHAFPPDSIISELHQAIKSLALPSPIKASRKLRGALIERLDSRASLLQTFEDCLDGMQPTEIGECLESLNDVDNMNTRVEPVPTAFSIKIQRQLASSVPPRPMVAVERSESAAFFRQTLNNIDSAFEMFCITHNSDLSTAYRMFMSQKPEPSVYVRALLQSFLTKDDLVLRKISIKDFLVEDLTSLVLPASLLLDLANDAVESPVDKRFRIASQMTQFISKVAPPFINQYQTLCQNRSRLRRLLCHAAIELDNIQADAEDTDGFFQTLIDERPVPYPVGEAPTYAYPLSSWIYHHKLSQLQLVVHMGFELSVYAAHEFADMYWYLSHLTSLHLSHLERISYFISSQGPSQAGKSKEAQTKETQDALGLLYRHFSRLKAIDTLASALHRVYTFLQRNGHCGKVTPAYSTDELRFNLRMRPSQSLSIPEPLTFDEMKNLSSLQTLSDRELLDQASRLALTSRKAWEEILKHDWNCKPLDHNSTLTGLEGGMFGSLIEREWKQDIRNSMKACIGTSIAVTALLKALDNGGGRDGSRLKNVKISILGPDDKTRFHRWWAVPSISR